MKIATLTLMLIFIVPAYSSDLIDKHDKCNVAYAECMSTCQENGKSPCWLKCKKLENQCYKEAKKTQKNDKKD